MFSVESILNLPPDDLEKVLKAGRKKILSNLLEKLFDLGLVDKRFERWEIIDNLLDLSDEELYQKLPKFILEGNPTRGEAIVFLYNIASWYCSLWDPYTVNGLTFKFDEHLSKDHPIGYFLGDHFKVTLSERYFEIFKKVLETTRWTKLSR